jgi:uncharacterized membrane protein
MWVARRVFHQAFEVGIFLKGVFAVSEMLTGLALFLVSHETIPRVVHWVTSAEISQDPNDLIARALLKWAEAFSVDAQSFFALYLLSHGAIKLIVVVLLVRGKLWAYPLAVAVFSGFVIYQMHRYWLQPDFSLIALSVLDLAVIVLTLIEYRRLTPRRGRTG